MGNQISTHLSFASSFPSSSEVTKQWILPSLPIALLVYLALSDDSKKPLPPRIALPLPAASSSPTEEEEEEEKSVDKTSEAAAAAHCCLAEKAAQRTRSARSRRSVVHPVRASSLAGDVAQHWSEFLIVADEEEEDEEQSNRQVSSSSPEARHPEQRRRNTSSSVDEAAAGDASSSSSPPPTALVVVANRRTSSTTDHHHHDDEDGVVARRLAMNQNPATKTVLVSSSSPSSSQHYHHHHHREQEAELDERMLCVAELLLEDFVGLVSTTLYEEERLAWIGLLRKHDAGRRAARVAERDRYASMLNSLVARDEQEIRSMIEREQAGAVGRIRRAYEKKRVAV